MSGTDDWEMSDLPITPRVRTGDYDDMLRRAYQDRQKRHKLCENAAEAKTLRETLRKAGSRLKIGLDTDVVERDGKVYVVLQARDVRPINRKPKSDDKAEANGQAEVKNEETPQTDPFADSEPQAGEKDTKKASRRMAGRR
jgi:hypothetical protein